MAKSSEAGDTMTPPLDACSASKGNDISSSGRRDHDLIDASAILVERGYRLGPKLGKVGKLVS